MIKQPGNVNTNGAVRVGAATDDQRPLWMAVILQQIEDATRLVKGRAEGPLSPTQRRKDALAARRCAEARDYLLSGSEDFRDVCTRAGVDPDQMETRCNKLADAGWPYIKAVEA